MQDAKEETFISVDVETSGPNPSDFSLLSIGACTLQDPRQTFYIELQPVSNRATAEALAISGLSLDTLRQRGLPPSEAMACLAEWLHEVVPADSRANTERVRKALSLDERPRIATAEESEQHLRQQIGGNSPLNTPNAKVLIDPKVLERDWILTGGGDNQSLVKISIPELQRIVEFETVRIRK